MGGSGGSRVSLLTAVRHPEVVDRLALVWISGGVYGLLLLATHYCGESIRAAWQGGMEAVAALPEWAEVIEKNPRNRARFLALDPRRFIETLERWMLVYCPAPDSTIPGLRDDELSKLDVPTLIFRSGASDPHHTRVTSETLHDLIPGSRLVEPPWPDDEWKQRGEAPARWHRSPLQPLAAPRAPAPRVRPVASRPHGRRALRLGPRARGGRTPQARSARHGRRGAPRPPARPGPAERRERLARLFDPGTFFEIGSLVGTTDEPPAPGDAFVAGAGRIDGRPVLAGAEDFTVLGGSIGSRRGRQALPALPARRQERMPLVIHARRRGPPPHQHGFGSATRTTCRRSPSCRASCRSSRSCSGPPAGTARCPGRSADFMVMTERASMFSAGPPLVKSATGEDVTKEELGGPQVHVDGGRRAQRRRGRQRRPRTRRRYLVLPAQRLGADAGARRTGRRSPPARRAADLVPPDHRRPYSIRPVIEASWTAVRCSRSSRASGARSSRRWRASADAAWRSWPTIPSVRAGSSRHRRGGEGDALPRRRRRVPPPRRVPRRQPRGARGHEGRAAGQPAPRGRACSRRSTG